MFLTIPRSLFVYFTPVPYPGQNVRINNFFPLAPEKFAGDISFFGYEYYITSNHTTITQEAILQWHSQ